MSRGERFSAHSKMGGVEIGLRRVGEVLFVCVVALAVPEADIHGMSLELPTNR